MPSAVTLTVADKATEANEGNISITAGNNEYILSTGDGVTPATAVAVTGANKAVMGDCIMLPVEAAVDGNFKAKIKLTLNNNSSSV